MILIRTDANEVIGAGHVMRCLPIAHSFKDAHDEVLFITADHRGDSLITSHGFNVFCLESLWTNMESELCTLHSLIDEYKPTLTLIDSYYVTDQYFEDLSKITRVAYIDDLNEKKWKVDFLINYNIFSSIIDYSSYDKSITRLMLQTQYVPLRNEFKNAPTHVTKTVNDILISAGGADPEGIVEKIIGSVCNSFPKITFHFVIGALNPRLNSIKLKASTINNAVLHINERHMAELMQKCDIAISAAGSTLYELCAMGTPTIAYSLADNQLPATDAFYKMGLMLDAGDCRRNESFINNLIVLLEGLITDYKKRSMFSSNMQALVDGNGSNRIVTYIKQSLLHDAKDVLYDEKTHVYCDEKERRIACGRTKLGRYIKVEFTQFGNRKEIVNSCVCTEYYFH